MCQCRPRISQMVKGCDQVGAAQRSTKIVFCVHTGPVLNLFICLSVHYGSKKNT